MWESAGECRESTGGSAVLLVEACSWVRGWPGRLAGVRHLMGKQEEDADGSGRRSGLQGRGKLGPGSGAERQGELPGESDRASGRGWPWSQSMLGHEPPDGVGCGGGFEPAHRSATAGACVEVFGEHVSQEPRPPATSRAGVGVVLVAVVEQQQLVARCRRRMVLSGVDERLGHHLGT